MNRLTILSASGYYATLAFVTAFVDQDRYTSVEKIERIARQMGLDYASGQKNLLESGMSELNRAIVKRTKRPAPARREPSYEEMCSPNFDFVNYDFDSYDTDELHRTTMTIGGAVYQITRHYRDSGAAVMDKLIRLMEKELRSAH